ncbi:MAG: hypothetical protein J6I60_05475 [Bacteroidaceae bacterium]|nr:hypothetical protein [Bacteroidaceae bacterium]
MNTCIFTIVAKNYIGLAKMLEQSLRQYHEVDFRIYVVDEPTADTPPLPDNTFYVKDCAAYSQEQWTDMAFKYDLTEFCTAVKPACFQHVFQAHYDSAIYFDPDIYVFSPLTPILEALEQHSIVLTPQIANVHVDYQGEHPEWAMNVNGIFNLGFCAMRRTTTSQLVSQWWRERLTDNAFTDRSVGNFTDQKWMDWMPGFLGNDELCICHHLGMNMAPWNFFERQLFARDGQIWVRPRVDGTADQEVPLVFFHFAGYDYNAMQKGEIQRKRIGNLKEYEDIRLATQQYMQAMLDNVTVFNTFIGQSYTYATYEDGRRIDSFHRRLYHGCTLKGETFHNPFSTQPDSFRRLIDKKHMIVDDNVDRLNQRNMPDIEKKHRMIHRLFRMLYRIMGYKRYTLFVKSLYNYCRPEMHTFLIKH